LRNYRKVLISRSKLNVLVSTNKFMDGWELVSLKLWSRIWRRTNKRRSNSIWNRTKIYSYLQKE